MKTEELAEIQVEMTVTEVVTYEFPVTVEVPVSTAGDVEKLTDYLVENEDLWLDDLPITGGANVYLSVTERDVEKVRMLPRADGMRSK